MTDTLKIASIMNPTEFILVLMVVYLANCNAENVQVEYYTKVTLNCDYNTSIITDAKSKYWILPTGQLIDQTTSAPIVLPDKNKEWQISEDFDNFNITINKADDDDFGVYYCIVVHGNNSVSVVQQGLNVDGPYFGKLFEQYKQNAMIGGIAAAVLFGVIATLCVVWNFRYSKKKRKEAKDTFDVNGVSAHAHINEVAEMEEIKLQQKRDPDNLYPNVDYEGTEKL